MAEVNSLKSALSNGKRGGLKSLIPPILGKKEASGEGRKK